MASLYSFHMYILFCFFPQSDEMYINHISKGGIGVNINPLQIATHFECPDALVVILQYLLGLCKKDKDSTELRKKLSKIMHVKEIVKKTNKSLMQVVLGNRMFYASQNIFLQIENYIHKYDSISVKRCILEHMGSGVVSKEAVSTIKKMLKKKIGKWEKTKIALMIFVILLPLSLLPFCFDTGTDTLLLVEYGTEQNNTISSNTIFDTVSQGETSIFGKSLSQRVF